MGPPFNSKNHTLGGEDEPTDQCGSIRIVNKKCEESGKEKRMWNREKENVGNCCQAMSECI
jgi:hypothetical protein